MAARSACNEAMGERPGAIIAKKMIIHPFQQMCSIVLGWHRSRARPADAKSEAERGESQGALARLCEFPGGGSLRHAPPSGRLARGPGDGIPRSVTLLRKIQKIEKQKKRHFLSTLPPPWYWYPTTPKGVPL